VRAQADATRQLWTTTGSAGGSPGAAKTRASSDSYFLPRPRWAPPALLAIAFPPCLTAFPASRTADAAPLIAPPAARLAWLTDSPASRLCRVPAAFLPAASDFAFLRLRARVAAPFFAAAERSALVCAITSPFSPSSTSGTTYRRSPRPTKWSAKDSSAGDREPTIAPRQRTRPARTSCDFAGQPVVGSMASTLRQDPARSDTRSSSLRDKSRFSAVTARAFTASASASGTIRASSRPRSTSASASSPRPRAVPRSGTCHSEQPQALGTGPPDGRGRLSRQHPDGGHSG